MPTGGKRGNTKRRGTSRTGLLAQILDAERVREQARRYGWDVAEDEERWRRYQKRTMAQEYRDDQW